MNAAQIADLRAQSTAFWRRKQPHNRRPQPTPLKALAHRHARRWVQARLRSWVAPPSRRRCDEKDGG